MRIKRFHIQGYKSIVDLAVDGLSDINVFFGLNDVGKSNIFEALNFWRFVLLHPDDKLELSVESKPLWDSFFRLQGSNAITINVDFQIEALQYRSTTHVKKTDGIVYEFQVEILDTDGYKIDKDDVHFPTPSQLSWHTISAGRRLHPEQRKQNGSDTVIGAENLKQALFYAYLSTDLEQKKRLNSIRHILAESPYELGELDIALDPNSDQIRIGFVRPNGRLPLETLGSGVQQLLLVLGQIFLNDYPVIAIEEPEMNLSPQFQSNLMATLETLMRDPAVKLEQLFISTHSPYFEFTQNFYDVTYEPAKGTQVHHATNPDYNQHFAITPTGPDTGARLNSMNQVKLYEGVINDLGLQRGDLVVFVPNDQGHWEIRSGEKLADEFRSVTNGSIG